MRVSVASFFLALRFLVSSSHSTGFSLSLGFCVPRYDKELLWTSDDCDGGHLLARGARRMGEGTLCMKDAEPQRVRCCADVSMGPTILPTADPTPFPVTPPAPAPTDGPTLMPATGPSLAPVFAPSPSPSAEPSQNPTLSPPPLSASTCEDLGWRNTAQYGSKVVCGESDLGLGGCSGTVDWAGAKLFCEAAGARLCSAAELKSNEARGTGCGYDTAVVWSQDACADGYTAMFGATSGGSAMSCTAADDASGIKTRCCADVVSAQAALAAAPRALRGGN